MELITKVTKARAAKRYDDGRDAFIRTLEAKQKQFAEVHERRKRNISALELQRGSSLTNISGEQKGEDWRRKEDEARARARERFASQAQESISKTLQLAEQLEKLLAERQQARQTYQSTPGYTVSNENHHMQDVSQRDRASTPENLLSARAHWIHRRRKLHHKRRERERALNAVRALELPPSQAGRVLSKNDSTQTQNEIQGFASEDDKEEDEHDEEMEIAIEQVTSELSRIRDLLSIVRTKRQHLSSVHDAATASVMVSNSNPSPTLDGYNGASATLQHVEKGLQESSSSASPLPALGLALATLTKTSGMPSLHSPELLRKHALKLQEEEEHLRWRAKRLQTSLSQLLAASQAPEAAPKAAPIFSAYLFGGHTSEEEGAGLCRGEIGAAGDDCAGHARGDVEVVTEVVAGRQDRLPLVGGLGDGEEHAALREQDVSQSSGERQDRSGSNRSQRSQRFGRAPTACVGAQAMLRDSPRSRGGRVGSGRSGGRVGSVGGSSRRGSSGGRRSGGSSAMWSSDDAEGKEIVMRVHGEMDAIMAMMSDLRKAQRLQTQGVGEGVGGGGGAIGGGEDGIEHECGQRLKARIGGLQVKCLRVHLVCVREGGACGLRLCAE
jgi:hypothetical protein